jgi:hypothetical protein
MINESLFAWLMSVTIRFIVSIITLTVRVTRSEQSIIEIILKSRYVEQIIEITFSTLKRSSQANCFFIFHLVLMITIISSFRQ